MEQPILDTADVLDRVDNDLDFLKELSSQFFADFPAQAADLEDALRKNDPTVFSRKAHAIKGALKNLGGVKSGALAHKLELAGKEGDLTNAPAMLSDLKSQVAEFEQAYHAFFTKQP